MWHTVFDLLSEYFPAFSENDERRFIFSPAGLIYLTCFHYTTYKTPRLKNTEPRLPYTFLIYKNSGGFPRLRWIRVFRPAQTVSNCIYSLLIFYQFVNFFHFLLYSTILINGAIPFSAPKVSENIRKNKSTPEVPMFDVYYISTFSQTIVKQ